MSQWKIVLLALWTVSSPVLAVMIGRKHGQPARDGRGEYLE
jgi:hypothetical protein